MSAEGIKSFSNFAFVMFIIMMLFGGVSLVGLYGVFDDVSIEVVEGFLYVVLSLCIWKVPKWFGELSYVWGLLFAGGLTCATVLTMVRIDGGSANVFYFMNVLIYAVVGMYLKSTCVCAVSVMFLMFWLEFRAAFGIGHVVMGYEKPSMIPFTTSMAGVVTGIGLVLRVGSYDDVENLVLKYVKLFVPGMLWFGSFVFYLSLLIVSSSPYCSLTTNNYFIHNSVAMMMYIGAVFGGNYYNVAQIRGFGGTFFVLWMMEKCCEFLPFDFTTWAWSTFVVGILGFGLNMYGRVVFEGQNIRKYFSPFESVDGNGINDGYKEKMC